MTREDVVGTLGYAIERWGFPVLAAVALGYFIRSDLLKPLVAEHTMFLRSVSETQREIAEAMNEQTRLLYALQKDVNNVERQ